MSAGPVTAFMVEAAKQAAKQSANINPVIGGIIAVALLLTGFGKSGIPGLIEKAMDENSGK